MIPVTQKACKLTKVGKIHVGESMSIDEIAIKLTNTMPIIKSQRHYLTPLTTRNIILAAILLHRFLTKPLAKK